MTLLASTRRSWKLVHFDAIRMAIRRPSRWLKDLLIFCVASLLAAGAIAKVFEFLPILPWWISIPATFSMTWWAAGSLIQRLRKFSAFASPVPMVAAQIFLISILGISAAASLSLQFHQIDVFTYKNLQPRGGASFGLFGDYFIWVMLEMLPALKVSESFSFEPPIRPEGVWGGILVLGFRLFVLYGIVLTLAKWWKMREDHAEGQRDLVETLRDVEANLRNGHPEGADLLLGRLTLTERRRILSWLAQLPPHMAGGEIHRPWILERIARARKEYGSTTLATQASRGKFANFRPNIALAACSSRVRAYRLARSARG
jgi:hypothetical protein